MKTFFCILFALLFVACGGADNSADKLGEPLGVSVTDALKADCPNGGVVINQGIDSNGNGKIDTEEITSSEKVCNGVDGYTNKIVKNIFCTGDITPQTVASANPEWPMLTITAPVIATTAIYTADVFASGDVFVYAGVYTGAEEVGASIMYAATQTGAATAMVIFTADLAGHANGGYWEMYLDRATLTSTLVYHDTDLVGGKLTWTKPSADCVVNSY